MAEHDQHKTLTGWRAAKTVFWSFLGIRRKSDYQSDVTHLKPVQVIVAGLIGVALLVGAILFLVYLVTR
ncbi:hypothetical protein TPL01_14110 [Sulfuriferula plumbiphila]|uniref:DUF2970 domain-containing protein n=1 Tax=Sulfuriferula plumbiphila TaxID=171865 RepID=A0A512L710_9PROT|nr:DUF2970 domain-containing protein [Sulfuriferula plumbiphila]BBP02860.1 hypothetical protein SFPGR_02820 [Sulfuriferula plumbiphila]GEP30273.1 hypothetical protein TPL01_14110 [Sulfuriferula plumbiphila]